MNMKQLFLTRLLNYNYASSSTSKSLIEIKHLLCDLSTSSFFMVPRGSKTFDQVLSVFPVQTHSLISNTVH